MQVDAVIMREAGEATNVHLTQEDQDHLARIFELGVNVEPHTYQAIRVVLSTPGYKEA